MKKDRNAETKDLLVIRVLNLYKSKLRDDRSWWNGLVKIFNQSINLYQSEDNYGNSKAGLRSELVLV